MSQQGSKDCPLHSVTVDTPANPMSRKKPREPEKQTGEMDSGEDNNSTTEDKVIVKPTHLKSAVWRFFGFLTFGSVQRPLLDIMGYCYNNKSYSPRGDKINNNIRIYSIFGPFFKTNIRI